MDIVNSAPASPHETRRLSRHQWHLRAGAPMLGWMLAVIVVVAIHREVPRSVWLMVHLVTLGIASNAIVVWSSHFTDAVLRSQRDGHRREVVNLWLLNAGLVALSIAVVGQYRWVLWSGVIMLMAMAGHTIVSLGRQASQSLPSRFGELVRWYQTAAAFLVVGVLLGGLMALPYGRWSDALLASHIALNALGWVGLTVWGTLATLWPTILRTRAPEGVELAARRALPLMAAGVAVMALAPLAGLVHPVASRWVGVVGVLLHLAGVVLQVRPIVSAWWGRRSTTFAALSVGAAQIWYLSWMLWLGWQWASADAPGVLAAALRPGAIALVVGFLVQVVLGALSHLVPVVLGGGPAMVRTTTAAFERGGIARWAVLNGALATYLLPITSVWKVTTSLAAFVALALFLVPLLRAVKLRRKGVPDEGARHEPMGGRMAPGLVWATAWLVLAMALAAAVDPVSFKAQFSGPRSGQGQAAATGRTTTVDVEARGMRFVPDRIVVPAGDRLVVNLVNQDEGLVHDLVVDSGTTSGRLLTGQSASVDLGVMTQSANGWCSVAGHRQMGMVLTIEVQGAPGSQGEDGAAGGETGHDMSAHQSSAGTSNAPVLDLGKEYSAQWMPRDARLAPASGEKVHRQTLRATEQVTEVAPGVEQTLWTFNGQAPGPALRGRVGDRFEITLVNDGSMGHSIDFHAGDVSPDAPMRTIAPGESLVYTFTARRSGIWMYHCATMPMSQHIANGMYGAVVIDPPELPKVDHEFLLVQAEQYFGAPSTEGSPGIADLDKIRAERPDAVVFNGHAGQYDRSPLQVRAGERVRIWVLAAGPSRSLAFHVVGAQFDQVWSEGAWRLQGGRTPGIAGAGSASASGGSQTLGLHTSQGGFVEMMLREPGHYAMVNHQMVDAERGAHGILGVR